ncbi:MAG TPA: hypothetical protein PKA58_30450 [Polyangium sp.]|nr:hypothetical protein [Polyangium sp.]
MVEHVAHVARSIPPVSRGIGGEQFEIFLEGEKTSAGLKPALNSRCDVRKLSKGER